MRFITFGSPGKPWSISSRGRLIVLKNLPIMLPALLQKFTFYALQVCLLCSNYAQQESIRLCTNIMWATFTPFRSVQEQTGCFFRAPVCGGAFTLTFHFRVNSDRVGAQSWLSKDFGELAVSCELLPGAWDSLTGLLVAIMESPRGQVSAKL